VVGKIQSMGEGHALLVAVEFGGHLVVAVENGGGGHLMMVAVEDELYVEGI
jgi:hypothetical protein